MMQEKPTKAKYHIRTDDPTPLFLYTHLGITLDDNSMFEDLISHTDVFDVVLLSNPISEAICQIMAFRLSNGVDLRIIKARPLIRSNSN